MFYIWLRKEKRQPLRLFIKYAKLSCVFTFIAALLGSCGWKAPEEVELAYQDLPEVIDFNYHVKPILSDKCFACHGPDATNQKSELRLDKEEYAYAALEGNTYKYAIVPGKPGKSGLVKRILSDDEGSVMPPPESNLSLDTKEIAILLKWIEQGAAYKPHWSFIKPEKIKLPKTSNRDWAQNEIDFFVGEKLEKEKLSPADKASKENLIRRLSFDLTGLPPSLEQIEDFVRDTTAGAYEKRVDQLLASPAYGERMAADWMDVARYADSDGYLDDKHRDFSPYRDWVIQSFNSNMPYDEFITMQLAGDLVEHPTKESVLATAFNRLHKRNSEAGIVFEEYRVEYVADRTLTVGKGILGLSMECARCHDHKFDPISQKEYYEMAAFFNSTNEIGTAVYGPGQVPGPSMLLTNEEQEKILHYIDKKISKSENELKAAQEEATPEFEEWITQRGSIASSLRQQYNQGLVAYYPFDQLSPTGNRQLFESPNRVKSGKPVKVKEPDIKTGAKGKGIFLNDFTTITLPEKTGWFDYTDPFSVSLSVFPDTVYEEAGLFYHCEDLRLGLKGYSLYLEDNRPKFIMAFSWPTNAIQVKTKDAIPEKEWTNITVSYNGLGTASGVGIYLNGESVPVEIEVDNLYKSILFEPDIHTYGFRGFTLGMRDKMKTFIEGGIDELKVYERELSALEVLQAFDETRVEKILNHPKKPEHLVLLKAYYENTQHKKSQQLTKELHHLKKERTSQLEEIPEIMVMGDLPEPRPTYILDRGLYSAPTEEVFPGIPKAVLPFNEKYPRNRLGLAQWIFDPENPLTARIFVNRLWQMHFGKGLVESSDDFGNQGNLPTHPELLDWLAIQFQESGWDIKKMHKLMVMSATYQQSSLIRPELQESDPDNLLLARGPSFRMTAEMVRDNALAISGLLSPKVGGPSVYPYQPEGLWDEISTKSWRYKYLQEPGEGLYRRSLYTIWKRTSGPPSMLIFDVNGRGECTVKRRQTSTPLQALVLLNDPQYLEAARVLAEKLITTYDQDTILQLKTAFRLSTGRTPDKKELSIIERFHQEEVERFAKNKGDALDYVSIGSSEMSPSMNPVKVAALATVINGIMNTTDGYTIR